MTWTYKQSTGEMISPNGAVTIGYSGHGKGRNNPAMQGTQKIGPIPLGVYTIGKAYDHPHLGPCVMNLEPLPDIDTLGRSLFRIHGNDAQNDASQGCVIIGPTTRKTIATSDDRILTVI